MQGLPPLPKSLTGLLSMGRESLSKASEATLGQVWSLAQFYSKGSPRISVKKGGGLKTQSMLALVVFYNVLGPLRLA